MRLLRGFLLVAFCVAASQPLKQYQDRREYDLAARIRKESDPERRLALALEWRKEYARSAFSQEQFYFIITAEQALGRGREMLRTAREMRDDDPRGLGNYWIALITVNLRNTRPQALAEGERAARELLRNLPITYAPGYRPSAVTMAVWNTEKERSAIVAHRTLGWISLCRQQWRAAGREFTIVLRGDPDDAEASYWLATSIVGQRDPATQDLALYYYARALAVSGPGELTPQARERVKTFLDHAYEVRHGTSEGLNDLIHQAKDGPFPSSGGEPGTKKPSY